MLITCRVNDVVTLLSLKVTDVLTFLSARCLEPCQVFTKIGFLERRLLVYMGAAAAIPIPQITFGRMVKAGGIIGTV